MRSFARPVVPALLLVALAAAARAQTAPQPAGHVSIASIDAILNAGKEMGLPTDGMVQQIESLPFLGAGSVDTTKPAGVILLAGDSLPAITSEKVIQVGILAVPVKEGKVTPESLKAAGAVALDDKPGVFKLGQFNIRRLGDYVLVQMDSTLGLAELKEVPFAADYKTPGNLFVASVDVDAIRKAAPDGYKQVLDSLKGGPLPPPLDALGGDAGDLANMVQKVAFALGMDGKNIHVRTWLTPLGPGTPPKPVARPAFPDSLAAQVHIVYPTGDSTDLLKALTNMIPDDAFAGMDKATEDKAKALALRAAKLFAGGTGVSIGFAAKSGRPVVYIVSQFSEDVDYGTEAKSLISAVNDIVHATDPNDKGPGPAVSEYDAGGKKVTRVVFPAGGPVVDCIAAGKVLYITISPHDGKYVQEIADAGLSTTTSTLLSSGVLNLGAIYDAATQLGAPMPADDDLKKALAGMAVTWTVQSGEGNVLYVDLALPKDAIAGIVVPALGRSRELANRSVDAADARGIAQSCNVWAADNNGNLPDDLARLVVNGEVSTRQLVSRRAGTPALDYTPEMEKLAKADFAKFSAELAKHTDFVYLGAGGKNTTDAELVLLYEKPGPYSQDGINMAFQDAHAEFVPWGQVAEKFKATNEMLKEAGKPPVDVAALMKAAGPAAGAQ